MSKQQSGSFWPVFVVLLFAVSLVGSCADNNAPSGSSAASSSSSERRYVEERFKREGYSSADSAAAADAVMKFQRAQEARRNR